MATIHFVYTEPIGNLYRRFIDKAISKLKIFPPLHRSANIRLIPFKKPLRQPHCISFNLLNAFKKTAKVKFYGYTEHTICKLQKNDIFIGTLAPDYSIIPHQHVDYQSVTYRTLKAYPNNKKFIIIPYTHDPLYVNWWKELLAYTDNLILICGKIWVQNWKKSPLYEYGPKNILRLDVGIDIDEYPQVKKKFNPKGKRKFLYMGHTQWYKNTKQLEMIAAEYPNFQGSHIGGGQIKGWKKISEFADLTPEFMSKIAEEYDVFLNTSSADANPRMILENMCFGFPIACTLESGYDEETYPYFYRLDKDDTDFNCHQLEMLQNVDEEEFLRRASLNREIAKKYHNWDDICKKVVDFINK
jgi:hypothetical protein